VSSNAQRKRRPGSRRDRVRRATAKQFQPRVGELAVCPPHGVGQVVAVGEDEVSGARDTYCSLQILGRGIRVTIPTRRVEDAGLRAVISPHQVCEVWTLLRRKTRFRYGANWAKRHRDQQEKLNSGSIFAAAEVLRDLLILRRRKELSVGERKLLDKASHLVVTELAHAGHTTIAAVEARIVEIFGPGCLG
jgi:CarD family transcriptional regulator